MEELRIRSADGPAPGIGTEELFGKLPPSAIGDPELECSAVRLLAAIDLDIVRNGGRVSLATNSELARMCGRAAKNARSNDEWVRRWLRRLEVRGHAETAPVRSIAGNPRGIRPLATLKRRCTPSKTRGCNPTESWGAPHENEGGAPRNRGAHPTENVGPILREGREKDSIQTAGSIGVRDEPARPTLAGEGEEDRPPEGHPPMQNYNPPLKAEALSPEEAEAGRAALRAILGARKSPGGPSAKSTPRGRARNSVRDASHSTGDPTQESRPISSNGNITPNI